MKLVLDTNVLVSALFWEGHERTLLQACFQGYHRTVTSPFILNELDRVLQEKFDIPETLARNYINQLLATAKTVDPKPHLATIEDDPSDNRILECALAAKADVIVTGDSHLLDLDSFHGIEICSAGKLDWKR